MSQPTDTTTKTRSESNTHWFDRFLPCYLAAFMLLSLLMYAAVTLDVTAKIYEQRFGDQPVAAEHAPVPTGEAQ